MKIKFFLLFTSIILLISCKNDFLPKSLLKEFKKGSIYLSKDTLEYKSGVKVALIKAKDNNEFFRIKTFFENKHFGHEFRYAKNKKLVFYLFNLHNNNQTYILKRAFMQDYYEEEGSPYVKFYCSSKCDTVTLYFSTFPRKDIIVELKKDGNALENVKLKTSKLMPYLLELKLPKELCKTPITILTRASNLHFKLDSITDNRVFTDTLDLFGPNNSKARHFNRIIY